MTTLIEIVSVGGALIAAWFVSLVLPVYRIATGKSREILLAILLLYGAIIAANIFWLTIIATPAAWRGPGTTGYLVTIVAFVLVETAPLATAVYLWKRIRG